MSLFRLDASIRIEGSHSRAIAGIVEQEWRNSYPEEPVSRNPPRGMGPRDRVDAPYPRRRLEP